MRKNHKMTLIDSLKYCQEKKGLEIFAWCLMPSHLHMIVRAKEGFNLSDIIRDFKTFTSKTIIKQIQEEPESRREWMLERFKNEALQHPKSGKYKFWQDGYHPVELYSPEFTKQKLNYLHNNPVEELLVQYPWDYMFSSARNYADMDYLLDVIKVV